MPNIRRINKSDDAKANDKSDDAKVNDKSMVVCLQCTSPTAQQCTPLHVV